MTHSTHFDEVITTRIPEDQTGVRVVRRHHLLVGCSHWLNLPILLGLILSGFLPADFQAKSARLESSVNLGPWGNPDPYYVSLDLSTARHTQTLLATHLKGKPLTVEHGAPLRLVVPVKLGLKNIKAITRISYTKDEPADYWAMRGYSRYDGIRISILRGLGE